MPGYRVLVAINLDADSERHSTLVVDRELARLHPTLNWNHVILESRDLRDLREDG